MQSYAQCRVTRCVSSQVILIYITLLTIQIESKQLHNIKIGTIKSNVCVCVRERERQRQRQRHILDMYGYVKKKKKKKKKKKTIYMDIFSDMYHTL